MPNDEPSLEELGYLNEIDRRIMRAANLMDCADVADADEEAAMDIYEERHHCGTCMVRTVLEEVWPAVDEYVDWLKSQIVIPR